MKKKSVRLTIISSVIVFLLVVILCTTTLMRLKDVSVEYATTCYYFSIGDNDSIINSGEFDYGSNLLFADFEKEIARIEQSNPYAKVINIERKFPNKCVIHIEERTPVFMVHNPTYTGQYSVYDKTLKVLHVSNLSQLYRETGEESVPILSFDENTYNYDIDLEVASGGFLDDEIILPWATAFSEGTYNYNATLTTIMSRIAVSKVDDIITFTINFDESDMEAVITGDNDLQTKIYNVVKIYSECSGDYSNYNIHTTYDGFVFGTKD